MFKFLKSPLGADTAGCDDVCARSRVPSAACGESEHKSILPTGARASGNPLRAVKSHNAQHSIMN